MGGGNMKLLVYGAGENTKKLIENKCINLGDVIGFIDKYKSGCLYEKKLLRIDEAIGLAMICDWILVTVKNINVNKVIYHDLTINGYPMEKVLFVYNRNVEFNEQEIHKQDDLILRDISMLLYESEVCVRNAIIRSTACLFDPVDKRRMIGKGLLYYDEMYANDYCRYRAFELVASEIEDNHLAGNCAEAGVFLGEFSSLINARFKNRLLYLYDSFESFRKDEYEKEVLNGDSPNGFYDCFLDTSVDLVLSSMKYPENCIIRKGFFPESIMENDKNERFVFVSLDMDFYESTLEGLKFFYPRLLEGGYIFIHDYHNHCFGGVSRAVEQFEEIFKMKLKKFPIPDQGGTLVITK